MMQSQQFSPKQKFKEFSSSFPPNPSFQGLFKCPGGPKLNSRAFQALQGVARTLFPGPLGLLSNVTNHCWKNSFEKLVAWQPEKSTTQKLAGFTLHTYMLIGQWRGYFFLNFAWEEGKITRSRLVERQKFSLLIGWTYVFHIQLVSSVWAKQLRLHRSLSFNSRCIRQKGIKIKN